MLVCGIAVREIFGVHCFGGMLRGVLECLLAMCVVLCLCCVMVGESFALWLHVEW